MQGDTDSESGPFVAVADAVAPKLRHFGMLRKNVCVWFRFFREGEGGKRVTCGTRDIHVRIISWMHGCETSKNRSHQKR